MNLSIFGENLKQSKPDEYMKKTLLLLFTLLLALSAQSQNSLRLMTYNIKNANGMDDVCDFQRIADVINHIHPEVVALQELDSMTHRSGQKYVLGRDSRMYAKCTLSCPCH